MKLKIKALLFSLLLLVLLVACSSLSQDDEQFELDEQASSTEVDNSTENDASDEQDEMNDEANDDDVLDEQPEKSEPPIMLRDYGHLKELLAEEGEEAQQLFESDAPVFISVMAYHDVGLEPADNIAVEFPDYWKLHHDNREEYEEPRVYFGLYELENDKDLEELVNELGSQFDDFEYETGKNPSTGEPTYMMEFNHNYDKEWHGKIYFHESKAGMKHALALLSTEDKWD